MPKEMYFEDFYVGQKMNSVGSAKVTAEEIKEFGQKYDPQPFSSGRSCGRGFLLQRTGRLRLAHGGHRHADCGCSRFRSSEA